MEDEERRFLTIKEVALELGEHPRSTNRRILAGEIQAINIAVDCERPTWRISREALEQYIDERLKAARELVKLRKKENSWSKADHEF